MRGLSQSDARRAASAGFSLLELLVVVGIIGFLALATGPPIRNYLRTYEIRGAASALASELQAARAKAINKNVRFGVTLVTVDQTHYRYVIEDDLTPPIQGVRQTVGTVLADPVTLASQLGGERILPQSVVLATTGPTAAGIRFGNLGAACDLGTGDCPALDGGTNFVRWEGANSRFVITLSQPRTGLFKNIVVQPGGRIFVVQGFTEAIP